jgi:Ni2+-binding GTPase involved in maturation of urease and hydrogenase
MDILEVSCTTGQGLDQWIKWLEQRREAVTGERIAD